MGCIQKVSHDLHDVCYVATGPDSINDLVASYIYYSSFIINLKV
jgi:hypothetical protein